MCGICGSAGLQDGNRSVLAMLARLVHRGPDDEGIWSKPAIALGHRRLAIVDLSPAGHQPMLTEDRALAATVNGEIYNYLELRKALEAVGARFQSHCDSEVVLHAYRANGTDSFRQLNGMFAFGLWDDAAKKLFVVRDRLGIKPVYYWQDASTSAFHFASEVKALLAAANRRRWQIDADGLAQYLTYQNILDDRTLLSNIRMVPPGHYVEYDAGNIRVVPYWQPHVAGAESNSTFEDTVERFQEKFSRAVGRHLMSDVPVACYLSSGFDSSMVCAEAAKQMRERPLAFTGYFDSDAWYDEATCATKIAQHLNISSHNVAIAAGDFERHFDDMVRALDEPRMGMGAFSQYMVAKAAATERKVILTGHGGDELFSGYPVFKLALLRRKASHFDASIGNDICSLGLHELPHLAYFAMQRLRGAKSFLPILFGRQEQQRVLNTTARQALYSVDASAPLNQLLDSVNSDSDYERILLTYLKIYLPGLLTVEDKISMAHSLESRTPFLDNELVNFSLGVPEQIKLHGGVLKAIVKRAARGVLPDDVFRMPKRGFPTPLAVWLRGPLSGWLRERISGPRSRLNRIFDETFLRRSVDSYLSSWRNKVRQLDEIPTHRIWMLLCLESWVRQTEDAYEIEAFI